MRSKYTIAIHGGAGTITRQELSAEKEAAVRQGLQEALLAGEKILRLGGSALDAVEAAVRSLEDNPQFNAGRGAVLNSEGTCQLDAAIMDGRTLKAGAVACVQGVKNPVSLARTIMDQSEYVLLAGRGAEQFAQQHGLAWMPEEYFITQERREELAHKQHPQPENRPQRAGGFGTVGAVALDTHGHLAAATSTGGLVNKQFNRVGDTPVIGGGTYANNHTCAVSCTGDGEYIMRAVAAYEVSCLLEHKGLSLAEACDTVIFEKLKMLGGEGGLIAVDRLGNVVLPYNSPSMYRACAGSEQETFVGIFNH